MSRPPLLLLPPSEGKSAGGRPPNGPDSFAEEFTAPRAAVVAELAKILSHRARSRRCLVLGVRGPLLERAEAATAAWSGNGTGASGVASLLGGGLGRTRACDTLAVRPASDPGALGSLRDDDRGGPRRRLPASADGFPRPPRPPLPFWRPTVTPALARRARHRLLIDLLPAEHAHAVDLAGLDASTRVVRVRFRTADGGRAVGHEAKTVKGRLARALVDGGLDAVRAFESDGWRARLEGDVVTVAAARRDGKPFLTEFRSSAHPRLRDGESNGHWTWPQPWTMRSCQPGGRTR